MAKSVDQTKATPASVKWILALMIAIVPAILAWGAMDHRTIDAESDIEELKEKKLDKIIYEQHEKYQDKQMQQLNDTMQTGFDGLKEQMEKIENKM